MITDGSGNYLAEQRYDGWGMARYTDGVIPTDKEYTGQRHSRDIELYDYKARFYDPLLGRFLMEDTIIPNQGVMKLDRYAYVNNRPVSQVDPSGNECTLYNDDGYCVLTSTGVATQKKLTVDDYKKMIEGYGVTLEGNWNSISNLQKLFRGIYNVAYSMFKAFSGPFKSAFQRVFNYAGSLHIRSENLAGYYGQYATDTSDGRTKVWLDPRKLTSRVVGHELGHAFQAMVYGALGKNVADSPVNMLNDGRIFDAKGNFITGMSLDNQRFDRYGGGNDWDFEARENGFLSDNPDLPEQGQLHPLGMIPDGDTASEQFADIFMNWSQNTFAPNPAGEALNNWMNMNMFSWISIVNRP